MRSVLVVIFACWSFISTAQEPFLPKRLQHYPNRGTSISFGDYANEHFEIGAGIQALLIVPGVHAKMRYAPINHNRIKVLGEVRGEAFLAPLIGWNYNVQLGTSFRNDVGLHMGFGRSQYIAGMRADSTQAFNRIKYNTVEFGLSTLVGHKQYDVFLSVPISTEFFPIFIAGISWTAGDLWYIRKNQGVFGRKQSRL